jgi:hypothetical protein
VTFKADWAKARLAYKNAPHGTKRARLRELQRMVADELRRESKPMQRGKIAA